MLEAFVLGVNIYSLHFESNSHFGEPLTNTTPGIYLQHKRTGILGGIYSNSHKKTSYLLGYNRNITENTSVTIGKVSGYYRPWTTIAFPSYNYNGIVVSLIPSTKKNTGSLNISFQF